MRLPALVLLVPVALGGCQGHGSSTPKVVRIYHPPTATPEATYDVPLVDTPVPHLPQATLTVYSDGCGVIRTEFARDPQNLSWSVKDAGGFQVLQRNAEGETRYRYFRSGHYTVTLTGFDGQKYAPASNTVSISC